MKSLDLNAYGVSEMSHQEMVETDGGGWLEKVAKAIIEGFKILAPELIEANTQVVKEGGTTVTNIGGSK